MPNFEFNNFTDNSSLSEYLLQPEWRMFYIMCAVFPRNFNLLVHAFFYFFLNWLPENNQDTITTRYKMFRNYWSSQMFVQYNTDSVMDVDKLNLFKLGFGG